MTDISFKAELKGIESKSLTKIFQKKTAREKNLKMVFLENLNPEMESDKFVLYKNGEKKAEYNTAFKVNQRTVSIERLLGIFNILKNIMNK